MNCDRHGRDNCRDCTDFPGLRLVAITRAQHVDELIREGILSEADREPLGQKDAPGERLRSTGRHTFTAQPQGPRDDATPPGLPARPLMLPDTDPTDIDQIADYFRTVRAEMDAEYPDPVADELPDRDTVTSLDPRDVGGWVWTVQTTDGPVRRYRTDRDYEGLWVWIDDGPSGSWRQTRGHMQAHWPTDRAEMVATLAQQSGYDVTAL